MGDLKFAKDLFLEVSEMDRLKKFLRDDGYQLDFKNNHETPGIVYNQYYDPNFSYFQAINIDVADTVFISPGFAYDNTRNVLTSTGASLLIPQRNTFYWVKISYKSSNTEKGTITLGGTNGGLMTGIGTNFLSLLRGQPNFPSLISFLGSTNYQQKYEVLEVVDDQTAYLQGTFPVQESGLQYAIAGTFTPGSNPPITDQYPFLYDDFTFTLVPETGIDVMPTFQQGTEFFVARITSTNTGVQIQDKRQFFISKTRAERLFSELPTAANPVIGIESITKTPIRNKIYYTVNISWGFRITTESRNYNSNKTTIIAGNGGTYASTNAFKTGDFDGWRYYYQNGDWSRIISSVKNGSGFDLQLDILKSQSPGAMVCPNAEEVEVSMIYKVTNSSGGADKYKVRKEKFYSFTMDAQLLVDQDELDSNFLEVDLQYRLKTVLNLTDFFNFNPSAYSIPGLSTIISNNIILTVNTVNPPAATAWRGINPFCVVDSLGSTIYYKIVTQNTIVIPTVYFPNSTFVENSTDETTVELHAQFFSDAPRTSPVAVSHNNLRIIVKSEATIQTTNYDSPLPGDTNSYNQVSDELLIYFVNPAGVTSILLGTVDSSNKNYEHQTNVISIRRITNDTETVYSEFPSVQIVVGNTGDKGFNDLEQYFTATSLPTGSTKPNLTTDPNYIAPGPDPVNCNTNPPMIQTNYGYSLNVEEVSLTGAIIGEETAPTIADTQAGGYQYILPQFGVNEQVTLKVQAKTKDSGNNTGFLWVRVTWQQAGSTSSTFTNVQVPNDVETTLTTVFTNISFINISNY